MSETIIVDGELWTADELSDELRRLRRRHCRQCHQLCSHQRALPPSQIAAMRREYERRGYHVSNARQLAGRYGVSVRTVHRYVSGRS